MPGSSAFARKLNVTLADLSLLDQALVHSSFCNENPAAGTSHNERLEFLGDAVLDVIVAEKLYRENPDMGEGSMSKRRAELVRRETLARVARGIGLGAYLAMGKGEEQTGGRDKTANLAGALEAVIAAVYLDRGYEATRTFVEDLLAGEWHVQRQGPGVDYKSRLQELSQARFQILPDYRLVSETGPAHDRRFSVEVHLADGTMGAATGRSKKSAENEAARQAVERLGGDFTEA